MHAVESPGRAAALDGLVDQVTLTRGEDDECWAEAAVAAAAAGHPPDGVLAFSEPQVLAAALVASELSLPGPSLRAAVLSRNKALQRGRLAAAGIRQPEYLITGRLAEAADWAQARFPVVVKSLSSAGSLGVELTPDKAAFANAVERRQGESPLLVEAAVVRAGVLAQVGDVLAPVVSSYQRRAYVLLAADDPTELERGLSFARRSLAIRTRQP